MLQKKNEGILFSAEIRVVGSYTDRLLIASPSKPVGIYRIGIFHKRMHFPLLAQRVVRVIMMMSILCARFF